MNKVLDIAIIGGGAAGFFAALNIPPGHNISILEESSHFLRKVKISGGGRCNVTHHEFDIRSFVKNYPRGEKELISPFHKFQAEDTVRWFQERGVKIKVEEDGRMFPVTNTSQTIIDCFHKEAQKKKIKLEKKKIIKIEHKDNKFLLHSQEGLSKYDRVLLATGSSRTGYELARQLHHSITQLAPSLFSFKIKHPVLKDSAGTSFKNISLSLKINKKKYTQDGDLLITHWGLSGPGILKLSAWAARDFKEANYKGIIKVNFKTNLDDNFRKEHGKSLLKNSRPLKITSKFWAKLLHFLEIDGHKKWMELSKKDYQRISLALNSLEFEIQGQNRFKDEFVECGGIDLKEVNFKTMESKITPGLFFAGEVLDVDGITGGFNFQNAWTTGFIAGHNITKENIG